MSALKADEALGSPGLLVDLERSRRDINDFAAMQSPVLFSQQSKRASFQRGARLFELKGKG